MRCASSAIRAARAKSKTTSLSANPVGPRAPKSAPPCAGSSTTVRLEGSSGPEDGGGGSPFCGGAAFWRAKASKDGDVSGTRGRERGGRARRPMANKEITARTMGRILGKKSRRIAFSISEGGLDFTGRPDGQGSRRRVQGSLNGISGLEIQCMTDSTFKGLHLLL